MIQDNLRTAGVSDEEDNTARIRKVVAHCIITFPVVLLSIFLIVNYYLKDFHQLHKIFLQFIFLCSETLKLELHLKCINA